MFPVDEKPRKGEVRMVVHAIVEQIIERALSGDVRAIGEIYNRVEGKAVATIVEAPPPDKPVDIMDAARRIAFLLNSAAILGEPVDVKFRAIAQASLPAPDDAPNS
jgi:hypothetical protein